MAKGPTEDKGREPRTVGTRDPGTLSRGVRSTIMLNVIRYIYDSSSLERPLLPGARGCELPRGRSQSPRGLRVASPLGPHALELRWGILLWCHAVLRGSGWATALETGPVRARLSGEVPPTSRAPPGEDGGRPGFTQAAPTLGRWGAPSRKGVPVPVRRVEHNGTCRSLFAQEAAGASRATWLFRLELASAIMAQPMAGLVL